MDYMKTKKVYSIDRDCQYCGVTFELKFLMLDDTFFTMSNCPDCGFPVLLDGQAKLDMAAFYEKASRLMGGI